MQQAHDKAGQADDQFVFEAENLVLHDVEHLFFLLLVASVLVVPEQT